MSSRQPQADSERTEHFSASQTKAWTECWYIRKEHRAAVFPLTHEESFAPPLPGMKQPHLCLGGPKGITHLPAPGCDYNPTSKVNIWWIELGIDAVSW